PPHGPHATDRDGTHRGGSVERNTRLAAPRAPRDDGQGRDGGKRLGLRTRSFVVKPVCRVVPGASARRLPSLGGVRGKECNTPCPRRTWLGSEARASVPRGRGRDEPRTGRRSASMVTGGTGRRIPARDSHVAITSIRTPGD